MVTQQKMLDLEFESMYVGFQICLKVMLESICMVET